MSVSAPPRPLDAWVSFLRAHAAITHELSAQLQRAHGLSLNEYEVLLHLSHAGEHRLRRVDLAAQVLLSASGVTRLLSGLERAGLVCRETCPSDARVSYAKLTDAGLATLREASATHLDGVDELFAERYSRSELVTLAELLARLPLAGAGAGCSPGA
jgi:DNA-binding MarR family transcriptional regulator